MVSDAANHPCHDAAASLSLSYVARNLLCTKAGAPLRPQALSNTELPPGNSEVWPPRIVHDFRTPSPEEVHKFREQWQNDLQDKWRTTLKGWAEIATAWVAHCPPAIAEMQEDFNKFRKKVSIALNLDNVPTISIVSLCNQFEELEARRKHGFGCHWKSLAVLAKQMRAEMYGDPSKDCYQLGDDEERKQSEQTPAVIQDAFGKRPD